MSQLHRNTLICSFILLTACGGGGGGSGGGSNTGGGAGQPAAPGNAWLQFTPSPISLTAHEGRALEFTVTGKSSKTIATTTNIAIVDAKGIISTKVLITAVSPLEYKAVLQVSEKLAAGTHSGELEIRLCEDSPLTCARPVEGSPWRVPLTVAVKSATNLTALAEQPQLSTWTMAGGNARHTGYVPLRLDPARFSQRWSYPYAAEGIPVGATPSVHQNGRAFIVINSHLGRSLRAVDEISGKLIWEVAIPRSMCSASYASLADGKVFVGSSDCAALHGTLNAFDQQSGALVYQVAMGNIESSAAPLVIGNNLYVHGRSDMGGGYAVTKINASTGAAGWSTSLLADGFQTMSADAEFIYSFAGANLHMLRIADGVVVSGGPWNTADCYRTATPAIGPNGEVYGSCSVSGGSFRQYAFDSTAKKSLWSLAAGSQTSPVISGTTVYAVTGDMLEARKATDGTLLWSSRISPDGAAGIGRAQYLLVTDNLAFVSGEKGTVAIDLASRALVWSFPQGGPMSISSKGVLYLPGHIGSYVTSPLPALVAINLL